MYIPKTKLGGIKVSFVFGYLTYIKVPFTIVYRCGFYNEQE